MDIAASGARVSRSAPPSSRAAVRWSPCSASGTTPSTTPSSSSERESTRRASAARGAEPASFHRIDAQPSGVITEYTASANISTSSATASASAPPLPPSPVTTATTGTGSPESSRRFSAIATAWPCCSAATPGNAPAVSISVTSGMPSLPARRMTRAALR